MSFRGTAIVAVVGIVEVDLSEVEEVSIIEVVVEDGDEVVVVVDEAGTVILLPP